MRIGGCAVRAVWVTCCTWKLYYVHCGRRHLADVSCCLYCRWPTFRPQPHISSKLVVKWVQPLLIQEVQILVRRSAVLLLISSFRQTPGSVTIASVHSLSTCWFTNQPSTDTITSRATDSAFKQNIRNKNACNFWVPIKQQHTTQPLYRTVQQTSQFSDVPKSVSTQNQFRCFGLKNINLTYCFCFAR